MPMNSAATNVLAQVIENNQLRSLWARTNTLEHITITIALTFAVHGLVKVTRHISEWLIIRSHAKKIPIGFVTQRPKFVTLTRLIVSAITFVIYFIAIGLVLRETLNFNFTAYLASASVVGLAISFGSQGLVEDVVIGVTLIFSDAIEVGDIVDLSGVIGRVESIGLRFTKLINFYHQEVFVPNRNITNVARFPHGGIYAYIDIQVPQHVDQKQVQARIQEIADGSRTQFGAIILDPPALGEILVAEPAGWNYLRVQFRIWPGQNALIETTFRQQVVSSMKEFDRNYADWMVTVTYRAAFQAAARGGPADTAIEVPIPGDKKVSGPVLGRSA